MSLHYLVTGARGGVGSAVLEQLRAAGEERVTAWDLPEVDVTDPQCVAEALARAVEERGPVDRLIHVAGTLAEDSALHPDAAALERCVGVNFGGVVTVCSRVAQEMVARGEGAIVVVSSNSAAVPRAGMAAYGASKAAATSWAKTLGLECAPHGVRVNVVSPGSTNTPMLQGMWPEGSEPREQLRGVIAGAPERFRLGIPLGRVAEPADIAAACLWLASPAARHITMHDLRVDGGATLDA